jgi:membrane protease subunit HflK
MSNSTKILVDTEGGNNMLYLPLDKLMQQGTTAKASMSRGSEDQMIDNIATEVIERLQRNSNQGQSERRR